MKEITGKFGFKFDVEELGFILRKPRFSPLVLMSLATTMMFLAAIIICFVR